MATPNGQFMGGSAMPLQTEAAAAMPMSPYYGIPPASWPVQIQGTGGYPSPGAGLISGFQAGQQIANNAVAARRQSIQWQQKQAAERAAQEHAYIATGGVPGGVGDPGNPQPSLLDRLIARARGVMPTQVSQPLTTSINAETGQALATLPNVAAPGMTATGADIQAANTAALAGRQPVGMQRGGVVRGPAAGNGVEVSHQAEPGISGYAAGGPVAAPGAPAPMAVSTPPQVTAAISPPPAAPAPGASVDPRAVLANAVEQHAELLHMAALDDSGTPNHVVAAAGGIPPAPDGKATSGPSGVPGMPHSLSPDFWDATDASARQMAMAAARAGQDPNQAYHSAVAMRNSYFQGQVLKNLSMANTALMSGDQTGVEQAIKNVYYYMPDGQDLKVNRGPTGAIQYQDPFNPVNKDGKPNLVDVTPEHLQLLGQSALDPMAVASTMLQYRMLPFNQRLMMLKAQGEYGTGMGRMAWGQAAAAKSQADLQRAPYQNLRDLSASYLDRARAASSQYALTLLRGVRLDPTTANAVKQTNSLVDNLVLGPPTQVPPTDQNGAPNISPAAGKVIHDTSRVPAAFQKISAMDLAQVHGWASGLVAANPRGMTPQMAAQVAAEAYQRAKDTHPGANGKPQNDIQIDSQRGVLHVWNRKARTWVNYPLASGTALPLGSVDPSIFQMAAGGAGTSLGAAPPTPGGQDFSNPPTWMDSDDASNSSP